MQFAKLQKFSLIDYPGKIAAVVFTYGCNFRCPFCHNPELVIEEFDKANAVSEKQILDFLKKRVGKLEGLVVTGGEPLLHKGLLDFAEKVKSLGFLLKIDTNGSLPEILAKIIKMKCVDYIAMDIKNSEKMYEAASGNPVDFLKIRQSIRNIMESGLEYEFRTTAVPGYHDEKSFKAIGKMVAGSKKFTIQNFCPGNTISPSLKETSPFTEEALLKFQKIMRNYVSSVEIINSF